MYTVYGICIATLFIYIYILQNYMYISIYIIMWIDYKYYRFMELPGLSRDFEGWGS